MKKITLQTLSLMALCLTMLITACSNNDHTPNVKTNYLQITADQSSFTEDDPAGIQVKLLLAFTPEKSTTVSLNIEGNDDGIVALDSKDVTFAAGEKIKTVTIKGNGKNLLADTRAMTLTMTTADDANIKLQAPLVFSVKPAVGIDPLTDAQKKVVEQFKQQTGIDLMQILGRLDGTATVKFQLDDKTLYNNGEDTRTITGHTIIALGDDATASHLTLKMKSNPLLMTDFLHDLLRKVTNKDVNEAWYQQPYPQAVMAAIRFDDNKETFDMTLNNIVVNSDATLNFIGQKTGTAMTDPVVAVPFTYDYSAWNRLKKAAEGGGKAVVDEGDTQAEYSLSDLILGGGSMDPNDYLFKSSIDSDNWENEPTDWIKPEARIDTKAGTLTFIFPIDFENGSGYTQVKVTYQLKK